ncbi:hypothetical protein K490DRAFT_65684 [Saccharata proteae CBS 121410]|uniref:Amino acid permease/ SLC12A domain-containing protein n=1 Tax=Saccharata proteae CBS 121410 TaxID=1314787 RepID=A0A9P4HXC3_9PEZI|nr:hypothetical protein K490DRAFT_65684 [Saccharata proteae CBS 121410]
MLATVLVTGIFYATANTAGNAIAFSKSVLVAANANTVQQNVTTSGCTSNVAPTVDVYDASLVQGIAIMVVTIVCFLHFVWSKLGLFLNRLFALYKIGLLLAVAGAGFHHAVRATNAPGDSTSNPLTDWGKHDCGPGKQGNPPSLAALVLIFYAYEGWENANYVAGEIEALAYSAGRRASSFALRAGAFSAVAIVTALYMLVTAGYYSAFTYNEIKSQGGNDLTIVRNFAQQQAAAVQGFLPFSKYLKLDTNTPKGALTVHWLITTITVVCIPNNPDGYSFCIGIFTYGYIIMGILVAVGFFRLPKIAKPDWQADLRIFHGLPGRAVASILFIGLNLIALIFGAKQRRPGPGDIDRMWWPLVILIVVGVSALYWALLQLFIWKGEKIGIEAKICDTKKLDDWFPTMLAERKAAEDDGTMRRMTWKVDDESFLAWTFTRFQKPAKSLRNWVW